MNALAKQTFTWAYYQKGKESKWAVISQVGCDKPKGVEGRRCGKSLNDLI